MLRWIIYIGLVVSLWAPAAIAQSNVAPSGPEANPGRPTVSTPATLTPVGYLQFESGVLAANHSPEFSSSLSLNEVIKLSVAPRLELIASAEPFARSNAEGATGNKVGDVFLGAQGVLIRAEGRRPTIAASYFRHIYDGGAPNLDIGSPSNSFLLLASGEVRKFHYDANALANEVVQGQIRRGQFGQTLSITHALAGKFALSGEIWHFTQPFLHSHAVGSLWALGYTATRTLTLDAGFNRGLTDTSTRWEVFAGFTYLLPHRLFGR